MAVECTRKIEIELSLSGRGRAGLESLGAKAQRVGWACSTLTHDLRIFEARTGRTTKDCSAMPPQVARDLLFDSGNMMLSFLFMVI
jgi:hypothetical protein